MKVQFILKKNDCYGFVSYTRRSSGLFNSTKFIVDSLVARGIEAEIIEVDDNNDIDREVTRFRPTIVVIEALWVIPSKFPVLAKLHPAIQWYVHLHSDMPFLAMERVAMDWIAQYARLGIGLITNSEPAYDSLRAVVSKEDIVYLPNVYTGAPRSPVPDRSREHDVNIGCFGAIRPLKNQLRQALVALSFAQRYGKRLRFHINASRSETGGEVVLENIVELFNSFPGHELVECPWMEPAEFLDYLSQIDIGMQVSLTETFNVVCADYVTAGVPVVCSPEVRWISSFSQAPCDEAEQILDRMRRVYGSGLLTRWNQRLLRQFSEVAQSCWYNFVVARMDE